VVRGGRKFTDRRCRIGRIPAATNAETFRVVRATSKTVVEAHRSLEEQVDVVVVWLPGPHQEILRDWMMWHPGEAYNRE
jgi:hypothetical protein